MSELIKISPFSVDIALPCLDEAEALPYVLERIPPGRRAIVVDNGFTDGSADLARALGADVVHEQMVVRAAGWRVAETDLAGGVR